LFQLQLPTIVDAMAWTATPCLIVLRAFPKPWIAGTKSFG